MNKPEILTKGRKKDFQKNDDGKGKAETIQIQKFSIDQNVLVTSIFFWPCFYLIIRIINPERN